MLTVGDAAPPVATILAPAAGHRSHPARQSPSPYARPTTPPSSASSSRRAASSARPRRGRSCLRSQASMRASGCRCPRARGGPADPERTGVRRRGQLERCRHTRRHGHRRGRTSCAILSPAAGAQIDPRTPLDGHGGGDRRRRGEPDQPRGDRRRDGVETRTIAPPAATRTETFPITFGAPLATGGTLNLNASARDRRQHWHGHGRHGPDPRCRGTGGRVGRTGRRRHRRRSGDGRDPDLLRADEPRHADGSRHSTDHRCDGRQRRDDRNLLRRPCRDPDAGGGAGRQHAVHDHRRRQRRRSAANPIAAPFTSTFSTSSPDGTAPQS